MKRVLSLCLLLSAVAWPSLAQQVPPKDQAATKPKKKLDADLSGFDVSEDKSGKKVSTMLGGTRCRGCSVGDFCYRARCAKFYGDSADFAWSYAGHSDGYVLIVTDEDETQLLRRRARIRTCDRPAWRRSYSPAKRITGACRFCLTLWPASLPEFVAVSADERKANEKDLAAVPPVMPTSRAWPELMFL